MAQARSDLSILREWLSDNPSQARFADIVDLITHWQGPEDKDVALAYAQEHLASWTDEQRQLTSSDIWPLSYAQCILDASLVRSIRVTNYLDDEQFQQMDLSVFSHIKRLLFGSSLRLNHTSLEAFFASPHLSQLSHIGLDTHRLEQEHLDVWLQVLHFPHIQTIALETRDVAFLKTFLESDASHKLVSFEPNYQHASELLQTIVQADSTPALTTLILDASDIEEDDLCSLFQSEVCTSLTRLTLCELPIARQSIVALAESPHLASLEALTLEEISIGSDELDILVRSPHMHSLRTLCLHSSDIQPEDLLGLQFAKNWKGLETLSINVEGMQLNAFQTLFQAPCLQQLHSLQLDYVGLECFHWLVESSHVESIEHLTVSPFSQSDEDVVEANNELISILVDSPLMSQLRSLEIESLGWKGAKRLAQTPHAKQLHTLSCGNVDFDKRELLHSALAWSPSLQPGVRLSYLTKLPRQTLLTKTREWEASLGVTPAEYRSADELEEQISNDLKQRFLQMQICRFILRTELRQSVFSPLNAEQTQLHKQLSEEPSYGSFASICCLFQDWEKDDLENGLQIANKGLASWPDEKRVIDARLCWPEHPKGTPGPTLLLAKQFQFEFAHPGWSLEEIANKANPTPEERGFMRFPSEIFEVTSIAAFASSPYAKHVEQVFFRSEYRFRYAMPFACESLLIWSDQLSPQLRKARMIHLPGYILTDAASQLDISFDTGGDKQALIDALWKDEERWQQYTRDDAYNCSVTHLLATPPELHSDAFKLLLSIFLVWPDGSSKEKARTRALDILQTWSPEARSASLLEAWPEGSPLGTASPLLPAICCIDLNACVFSDEKEWGALLHATQYSLNTLKHFSMEDIRQHIPSILSQPEWEAITDLSCSFWPKWVTEPNGSLLVERTQEFTSFLQQMDLTKLQKLDLAKGGFRILDEHIHLLLSETGLECIETLHLNLYQLSQASIDTFFSSPRLSHIKHLVLTDDHSDRTLKAIATSGVFQQLETLTIEADHATPFGIQALLSSPHLPRLTSFVQSPLRRYDSRMRISWYHPAQLQCTSLRELTLVGQPFLPTSFTQLATSPILSELTTLRLKNQLATESNPDIPQEAFVALFSSSMWRQLKHLTLDGCKLDSKAIQALASASRLRSLETLHLGTIHARGSDILALARSPNFPNLRALHLYGTDTIEASEAKELAASPLLAQLRELTIENCMAEEESWLSLLSSRQLSKIRSLKLKQRTITDKVIRTLSENQSIQQLHTLEIKSAQMGTASVRSIASAQWAYHLRTLVLISGQINTEDNSILWTSPTLLQLRLQNR